jgi:DNA replication protein DnaC
MQGTTINIDSQKNQNITINRNIDSIPTLYKDRSFNNFKAPGSLADKKKVCIDFALNKLNKKSLVMCGKVGTGKTHLAIAIAKNYRTKKPMTVMDEILEKINFNIKIIDADEFFLTLTDLAMSGKSKLEYMKQLFYNDLVILDDLGIANFTPAKQENLYYFINKCYQKNFPVVITTNFTLEQLENIDARIPSRLNEMATILSFEFDDYRLKK